MKEISKDTRVIALVGNYQSGKSSLLESLLYTNGQLKKKGNVESQTTVANASDEAKSFSMSTESTVASLEYQGTPFSFIDCPGSLEFINSTYEALSVCDAAVVVVDPKAEKASSLSQILNDLDQRQIPHFIFINKIETLQGELSSVLEEMQKFSKRPLVLKEIPLKEHGNVVGYVDLVSERAYRYDPKKPSSVVKIPAEVRQKEQAAREEMLEHLAEFDDQILEEVLSDVVPSTEEIHESFVKDLKGDLLVPVLIGGALEDNGTRRLMKELYYETPEPSETLGRLSIQPSDEVVVQVFKTSYQAHKGKLSYVRVWNGELKNAMKVAGSQVNGLMQAFGGQLTPVDKAERFSIALLSKFETLKTGSLVAGETLTEVARTELPRLFGLAVKPKKQSDELKLTAAIAKIIEQDCSLCLEQSQDSKEFILWGQGERHLQVALSELKSKFALDIEAKDYTVPYKETIEASVKVKGRHKKQSGGHGQFGDIHVEIKPLARGEGFRFEETITGGAVPKNYFTAIENGIKESAACGPLGFEVVDFAVTLFDGSYHKVDSSDQAFKMAAIAAMKEGLPKCKPLLLEPIYKCEISVPEMDLASAQKLVSGHRGSIFGFEEHCELLHWNSLQTMIPQAEMQNLITELRSMTHGLGYFELQFDHLEELRGRQADQVLKERVKH